MAGLTDIADFFVIASGKSIRKIKAIQDNIIELLSNNNIRLCGIEGDEKSGWLLLDYGVVIIHIFYPETREFYDLEHLWGDAEFFTLDKTGKLIALKS